MPDKLLKVFLVDNDPFCRQLLEHTVRSCGYPHVLTFENGAACLAALPDEPAIIFLDYLLGDMLGTEVLKAIKRFNPAIYVVLVSGQPPGQVAVDSLKYGAFDYVHKDERLDQRLVALLASIEQVRALRQSYQKLTLRTLPFLLF